VREERRLRLFENRVLRRIFGPKRKWRELHNRELNNLYISPSVVWVIKSRRVMCAGQVVRMGEGRGVYRGLVWKPDGETPLGRPRRRWEGSIKMDLQEVECKCLDWISLSQDRDRWRAIVNAVMNIRVHLNTGDFLAN
jgi:hypothetical protein